MVVVLEVIDRPMYIEPMCIATEKALMCLSWAWPEYQQGDCNPSHF